MEAREVLEMDAALTGLTELVPGSQREADRGEAAPPDRGGASLPTTDGSLVEPAEGSPAPPALSERDRQVLAFERQWWRYAGAKEQAIREVFGLSATRYYQVLNALLDSPAAYVHDPMLVKRLRRLRALRQRARSARGRR